MVAASRYRRLAELVQEVTSGPRLRVYTSRDVLGVEFGAAVKNIIAVAAGICDGLGLGDNAKAALMTRGMVELALARSHTAMEWIDRLGRWVAKRGQGEYDNYTALAVLVHEATDQATDQTTDRVTDEDEDTLEPLAAGSPLQRSEEEEEEEVGVLHTGSDGCEGLAERRAAGKNGAA